MLDVFLKVLLGVISSFALWFGGEKWVRYQRDKKARDNMIQEIREEIELNIALLTQLPQDITRMLENNNIPTYIPHRLRLGVYEYIMKSGEIRLLADFRKQRLIRYAAVASENFNSFIDNTEMLLAIFLLKSDGLKWAKYRLKQLIEEAKAKKDYLQDTLNKLQLNKPSVEKSRVETNNTNPESTETRIARMEGDISDIKMQLKESESTAWYHFRFMLGFAAIAIGAGVAYVSPSIMIGPLSPNVLALLIISFGIAIILISRREYKPQHFRRRLFTAGIAIMFSGVGIVVGTSFYGIATLPFLNLAGLLIFLTGYMITTIISRKLVKKNSY